MLCLILVRCGSFRRTLPPDVIHFCADTHFDDSDNTGEALRAHVISLCVDVFILWLCMYDLSCYASAVAGIAIAIDYDLCRLALDALSILPVAWTVSGLLSVLEWL